jgi:hypothetical protein
VAPPVLSSFAQDLYDRLAPLAQDDADNGYALALYCAAIGQMFQEVEDYARDTTVDDKDAPGWSGIVDINRAPSKGLAWLAQFVGVTLQVGLDDASQRTRILETDGWNRGTLGGISGAAHQYLTGAKNVIIRERDAVASPALPAYGLTVITYTSQTPDSSKVLAALLAQKPAGIILRYVVLTGQDYEALFTGHATYQNVFTTYATYQGIVTDQPGT